MTTVISYDDSGELAGGVFFELEISLNTDLIFPREERRRGWIANDPKKVRKGPKGPFTKEQLVWAEVLGHSQDVNDCPIDRGHVTEYIQTIEGTVTDLAGGDILGEFVPDQFGLYVVISRTFRDRLHKSGLRGFSTSRLPVRVNQSSFANPELWLLSFRGKDCKRRYTANVPKPNVCPFCGRGPVVCPGCGDLNNHCPSCEKHIVVLEDEHKGAGDPRFKSVDISEQGWILEGSQWDGSDFVQGCDQGFITKRAVDWFLKEDARPFFANPCRVDISGCDEKQLRKLKVAAGGMDIVASKEQPSPKRP